MKAKNPEVCCAYTKMVPLAELKGHPKNPNRHPKEQILRLAKLIERHGWRAPITVSKRSGFIVRGHGRWEAGLEIPCAVAPVDYQDYLDERSELEDLMADNVIQELAYLDREQAARNLTELRDFPDFEAEFTGFDLSEVDGMLADFPELIDRSETTDATGERMGVGQKNVVVSIGRMATTVPYQVANEMQAHIRKEWGENDDEDALRGFSLWLAETGLPSRT